MFPRLPIFFGNVIPEEYFTLPVKWANVLFYNVICTFIHAYLACIVAVMMTIGSIYVPFILHDFNLERGKGRRFKSGLGLKSEILGNPWKFILTYRSAQLVHLYSMSLFGWMLVPLQAVIGHMIVFSLFMASKYGDRLHPTTIVPVGLWSVMQTFYWCLALKYGGVAHSQGAKSIRSWKSWNWGNNRMNVKEMKKLAKSCYPLTLSYRRTFVVKKLTVLKFVRGLSKGVFRLLLIADK